MYLPELARDFRHVVTTGDTAAEARHQLGAHEILPHLVRIFADLHEPVGKPYGRVIEELGAGTARSLAVGDRLRSDVGSDTDRVVSILVNQEERPVNAGMIAYMVHILRRQSAADFLTAFHHLTITAMPEPDDVGPQGRRRRWCRPGAVTTVSRTACGCGPTRSWKASAPSSSSPESNRRRPCCRERTEP